MTAPDATPKVTTVKALTDAIYDAFQESGALLYELDNEQVYEAARLAAQTIESAGTTKAIVRAWLEENEVGVFPIVSGLENSAHLYGSLEKDAFLRLGEAIKSVQP